MYIISLKEKKYIKTYKFNEVGVNIILGVAKTDSNGVGKTAMVDALRMLLGEELPKDFKDKESLNKQDIMLVLKVKIDEKFKYLGRQLLDAENGFLSDDISLDIQSWIQYSIEEYRIKIQRYIFQNMAIDNEYAPSLQSIREYIIRDEKYGFNEIGLLKRKPIHVSKCLDFLSLLPLYYEEKINKLKNEQSNLENEINMIKVLAKDITKLRNEKIKIESDVTKMKDMLDSLNVNEKIDYDENKYKEAKKQLKNIETQILKKDYSKKQFEQSILNLEKKNKNIHDMVNLKDFYAQILKYFPDDLAKNYEQMSDFFEFMLVNRGDYFKKRVKELEKETEDLKYQKKQIQNIIANCTHIFQNSTIVDDIYNINECLNEEYMKLAEVKMKIDKYNEINDLTKQSNEKGKEIIEKNMEFETEYNNYSVNVNNIETHFKNLVQVAYKEDGILTYSYENNVKKRSNTGRIKIECQIADENSHGRLYMKINMFDLAMLLNRVDCNAGCTILVHDGSYCKPNAVAKVNIINYVDNYLKNIGRGQYFITINKSEVSIEDIDVFRNKCMVVAEFDREHGDEHRFFGCKY
jgi:uncharacterized protein YydD (DUF2326 family)